LRGSSIALLAIVLMLVFALPASASAGRLLTIRVYADGYVSVEQSFTVAPNATSVQLPILSSAVSDLVATDQNGSPLSYGFSPSGQGITVYTLGATTVTLNYDTDALTAKNGTVWTLDFTSDYNSTVILPQLSTLGYVSGTPYSINETATSPELGLAQGSWTISYGVPIESISTSTSNTQSATSSALITPPGAAPAPTPLEVGALAIIAVGVAGGVIIWLRRGRSFGPASNELRPDDLKVLDFINERGGRVLEPEVRMKFALPKTTAWRQIKRLERLGYVRVTKVGSQNQIEILRERESSG